VETDGQRQGDIMIAKAMLRYGARPKSQIFHTSPVGIFSFTAKI